MLRATENDSGSEGDHELSLWVDVLAKCTPKAVRVDFGCLLGGGRLAWDVTDVSKLWMPGSFPVDFRAKLDVVRRVVEYHVGATI